MSTPWDIQAGVPHVSVLSHTLYSLYKNDTPQTAGVYLGLFADNTCIYATDTEEGYVLRKLQRGLSAIETWCERWNIEMNEDKTQAIYFCRRLWPPEAHYTLNVRNIPFANHVKHLGVIFDKRITWRLHIEMIEAEAFRTYTRSYSLTHSWSWALLEKLPIVQLLENFPALYGTRRFITEFTWAFHWSLS
jgi:hypothetical protein